MADLEGAQLLANLLALPQAINNQRLEGAQTRAFLRQMGVPDTELDTYAPGTSDNPEQLGGGGTFGKILSGVGQTGAVLSQVLGAPIKAPRMSIDQQTKLKSIADDMNDRREGMKLAGTFTKPAAQFMARKGKIAEAYKIENGGGIKSVWDLIGQEADEKGLAGKDRTAFYGTEYARLNAAGAAGRAAATSAVADARKSEDEAQGLAAVGMGGSGNVRASSPDIDQWRPMVEQEALKVGIDPEWAMNVMAQESRGNPKAMSPKGAVGLMQLMPGTASDLQVDPTIPEQNISGGVRYLRQMYDRFNGDKTLATAAYNAGPGAVEQYGGVPPFKETRDYVRRVVGTDEPSAPWKPTRDVQDSAPSGGLPVTGTSVNVGTAKIESDDLELQKRSDLFMQTARANNIDPYTKDPAEVAKVRTLMQAQPGQAQAEKERGTMAARATPIQRQLSRVKQALTAAGPDGQPLLISGNPQAGYGTMATAQTAMATRANSFTRLNRFEQLGDKNVKAMRNFSLNMAGLAKALGDSGNISDTAIRVLQQYATGFDHMTQEEALATADDLAQVLDAIAAGAPSTLKDPSKGPAMNQQILAAWTGDQKVDDEPTPETPGVEGTTRNGFKYRLVQ